MVKWQLKLLVFDLIPPFEEVGEINFQKFEFWREKFEFDQRLAWQIASACFITINN